MKESVDRFPLITVVIGVIAVLITVVSVILITCSHPDTERDLQSGILTTAVTASSTQTVAVTTKTTVTTTTTTSTTTTITTTTAAPTTTANDNSAQIAAQQAAEFAKEQSEFQRLYALAETAYRDQLNDEIEDCQAEREEWLDKSEAYTAQMLVEMRKLKETYANRGLSDSGTYQAALNQLTAKYNRLTGECTTNIAELDDRIAALKNKRSHPDPNEVLVIVADDNHMSLSEAVEKYNMYM